MPQALQHSSCIGIKAHSQSRRYSKETNEPLKKLSPYDNNEQFRSLSTGQYFLWSERSHDEERLRDIFRWTKSAQTHPYMFVSVQMRRRPCWRALRSINTLLPSREFALLASRVCTFIGESTRQSLLSAAGLYGNFNKVGSYVSAYRLYLFIISVAPNAYSSYSYSRHSEQDIYSK